MQLAAPGPLGSMPAMAASDPLLYFDLEEVEHQAGREGGVHSHASCQHQLQGGKPAGGGPAPCTNILDFLLCYGSYEHILDHILGMVDSPGLQSLRYSSVPWARLVARCTLERSGGGEEPGQVHGERGQS